MEFYHNFILTGTCTVCMYRYMYQYMYWYIPYHATCRFRTAVVGRGSEEACFRSRAAHTHLWQPSIERMSTASPATPNATIGSSRSKRVGVMEIEIYAH